MKKLFCFAVMLGALAGCGAIEPERELIPPGNGWQCDATGACNRACMVSYCAEFSAAFCFTLRTAGGHTEYYCNSAEPTCNARRSQTESILRGMGAEAGDYTLSICDVVR